MIKEEVGREDLFNRVFSRQRGRARCCPRQVTGSRYAGEIVERKLGARDERFARLRAWQADACVVAAGEQAPVLDQVPPIVRRKAAAITLPSQGRPVPQNTDRRSCSAEPFLLSASATAVEAFLRPSAMCGCRWFRPVCYRRCSISASRRSRSRLRDRSSHVNASSRRSS